jgi:hypothetical protein
MVDATNSLIAKELLQLYESFQSRYTEEERSLLVSHFGTFSQDLINSIVEGNEELMTSIGDKKVLIKRTFSILIEGLQNIRNHGEEDEIGKQIGFLIFAKSDDSYKVNFGNLVKSSQKDKLEEQIDYINSLSNEEVKEYYMKVLTEESFSEKGGAGLGFITMKWKSLNPLNYAIIPVSEDKHFLTVEVLLERASSKD